MTCCTWQLQLQLQKVRTEIKCVQLASLLAKRGASGSVTLAGVALSPSSSLESSSLLGDSLLLHQGVAVAVAAPAAVAACWLPLNSVLLFLLLLRSISLISVPARCVATALSACGEVAVGAKYADRGTSLASPTLSRAKVRLASSLTHSHALLLPCYLSLSLTRSLSLALVGQLHFVCRVYMAGACDLETAPAMAIYCKRFKDYVLL